MLIPIERLMIPPVVYLHDRKLCPDIDVPYASGRRAFGAPRPLPVNLNTGKTRLPRGLRQRPDVHRLERDGRNIRGAGYGQGDGGRG